MRRKARERDHAARHGCNAGLFGRIDPLQYAGARLQCRPGMPVRPAGFRRLGQGDQQGGFGQGKAARFFVKPRKRPCPQPFHSAAVRRMGKVERQNFILGQDPLKREGKPDLAQLSLPTPRAGIFQQTGDLHRQGRPARYNPAMFQRLNCSAQPRPQIDAAVVIEPFVLVGDQHAYERGIDITNAQRHARTPVFNRIDTQQRPVAVVHLDRGFDQNRRKFGRGDPTVGRITQARRKGQKHDQSKQAIAPDHGAIFTCPVPVFARYSGRYISLTTAAGW